MTDTLNLDVSGLMHAISQAIAVGKLDREAATVSRAHHEAWLSDSRRLDQEAVLRFASVVGDIANKVRQHVANTMVWESEVDVPLMELSTHEYPGSAYRSPFQLPEDKLDPERLRFGGKLVFQYLERAGLSPRLRYVYNGDIRRYWMAIAIKVACPRKP
jgi:hypothetical protein